MAIENEDSTQVANTKALPRVMMLTHEWGGRLRSRYFSFTQSGDAGDAGSLQSLIILPKGKCRLFLPLCRLAFSAMGASRTMDLGWLAYNDDDGGDAVVADPNGLDDGIDVASLGSVIPGGTIGTHETKLFESAAGVTITSQINDGTIPAAATISGYFVYVTD